MLNCQLPKISILLFLIFQFSVNAYSEPGNTFELYKNKQTGFSSVLIENSNIKKTNDSVTNNKVNESPIQREVAVSEVIKTEIVQLKVPSESAVVVNKSSQFIFRNITFSSNAAGTANNLEMRASKVDYLRKQLKRY